MSRSGGKVSVENLKGDPRRPKDVRAFTLVPLQQEEAMPDYMSLVSLVFGLMGLMLKYRIFILQSLVCCVISLANMKYADMDLKQIMSSGIVVITGSIFI
eukprot:TRINITY_DN5824_c0_g1_i1.p1 TRINITY_DN5824_c0_g1~~TRINITY_DN5824_c0_g1_i1.p1  ORF type:complete len:100 (-),score=14.39 TRINITY_DN5824_c0_g1_i1:96-395(-)